MKELSKIELIEIVGGEVSPARKAGRAVGDFLAYCTAVAIYVADTAVDVIKTAADLK
jgi:hypothetical protein